MLTPGDGKVEINRRTLEEYFPRPLHQTMAMQPLAAAGYEGTVDVRVESTAAASADRPARFATASPAP